MRVLIPKTKGEIWLNRVRVWLPPAFVVVAVVLRRPAWHLWGLPLILLGEALRTWAAGHLLKDEELTVSGPYAHVRNPLYLGSSLSGVGFLVILGDWRLAAAFLVIAIAIYIPTVKQEEDYLRRMHGQAFEDYRRAVPGIVPSLRPASLEHAAGRRRAPAPRAVGFDWRRAWLNKEHKTWLALAGLFALLAIRSWRG
jgi:protein-S-isoprenylcysteine O-methyltransferase Ste14